MATTQVAVAPRLLPPATGRAGFADALRSEFTKIRSTRSTYWTLLALIVVTVGIGAIACAGAASHASQVSGPGFDPTQQSLAGLYVGQLVIAVLGALTITSEYSTGMIRTSLAVQPRRGVVFTAKAVVFAVVSLVTGLLFVLSILINFLPHTWQIHVDKWMPALAGSQIWTTKPSGGPDLFSAWPGFAVLAGYAVVAIVAGLVVFRTRDA
jgi:ABC-type transport system involved in multi-copper enzyme maturation permease subunit